MEKSKVYFTKEITPESLIKIYEALGKDLKGKVAVKISTGEPGGHNFLNPNLIKDLVTKLNGTIVECNTATDPVALDQACYDAVVNADDEGKAALIERMDSRHGIHTVEAANQLGLGSREYEIVNI